MKRYSNFVKRHSFLMLIMMFFLLFSFFTGINVGRKYKSDVEIINIIPTPKIYSKDFIPAINKEWFIDLPKFITNIKMDENYYLLIESKGIVTDIDLKGKYFAKTLFPFGIKYKSGKIDDWWYISKTLFNLHEVYIQEKGIIRSATIKDIKIGDKVVLQEIVNLVFSPSDPRHSKAWIVKIIR